MYKTKPVYYRGLIVEVPDWTNYIATDCDGRMFAFLGRPILINRIGIWKPSLRCAVRVGESLREFSKFIYYATSLERV